MKVVRKPGKGLDQLQIALASFGKHTGKVGWFSSSKYEDGTPVAYVASIQEFGYPEGNIPPRSTVRAAIKENQKDWKEISVKGAKQVLENKLSGQDLMQLITSRASGDIRKNISTIQEPPLKDSTIAARQRKRADKKTTRLLTKPLIDSGILLNTLTDIVETK